ncbi:MAG TPA: hypothetical protein VKU02_21745, partial [Gemmataceae bacterium]|nr:hypothetical protein [Gemmataceae bacterium]
KSRTMSEDRSDPEQLIKEGRKTLIAGGALLCAMLLCLPALAGFFYAGTLRLEQSFVPDQPEAYGRDRVAGVHLRGGDASSPNPNPTWEEIAAAG